MVNYIKILNGVSIPKPHPLADKPLQSDLDILGIVNVLARLLLQLYDFLHWLKKKKIITYIINVITNTVGNLSIQVPDTVLVVKAINNIFYLLYLSSNILLSLMIILCLVYCFFIIRYSYFNKSKVNLEVKMEDLLDNFNYNERKLRKIVKGPAPAYAPAPGPNGNDDDDDKDKKNKRERINYNHRNHNEWYLKRDEIKKENSFLTDKDHKVIDLENKNLSRCFNKEQKINPNINKEDFYRSYLNAFRKDPLGRSDLNKEWMHNIEEIKEKFNNLYSNTTNIDKESVEKSIKEIENLANQEMKNLNYNTLPNSVQRILFENKGQEKNLESYKKIMDDIIKSTKYE